MSFPHLWAVIDGKGNLASDAVHQVERAQELGRLLAGSFPGEGPYYVQEMEIIFAVEPKRFPLGKTDLHSGEKK